MEGDQRIGRPAARWGVRLVNDESVSVSSARALGTTSHHLDSDRVRDVLAYHLFVEFAALPNLRSYGLDRVATAPNDTGRGYADDKDDCDPQGAAIPYRPPARAGRTANILPFGHWSPPLS